MPFLRVLRDKRGYETTYLLHWFRDADGRQRSRVLYVFRTPPGVQVGRQPLEPAVMRELEAAYPDIEFDWRSLRSTQQLVETAETRRPRRPRRADGRDGDAEGETERGAGPTRAADQPPTRDDEEAQPPVIESAPASPEPGPQQVVRSRIPSAILGTTDEERVAWLREVYGDVRAEVERRTQDDQRRVALLALADRLNPDGWNPLEPVTQQLSDASDALMRLSLVFTRRRRRARRPGRSAPPPSA